MFPDLPGESARTYHEKDILLLVSHGDEKSFALLVDQYSRKLFIHILTFVKSYEVAEEMAQDIFLKIWQHRATLPTIKSFPDYLFIVSRNHLVSFLRKKLPGMVALADEHHMQDTPSLPSLLELKELSTGINNAISRLKPQQQKVFRLSREQGMTYQQIAAHLSISPETVKWHLAEALNSLRIYMRERGDLMLIGWMILLAWPEK